MADTTNNTGNRNTGNLNTGDWNTGDWNTGNRNTGDRNTGDRNTGYLNTGNWNTGDRNTGNLNTGNWNTGDRNTGNLSTGNWNTGDWNTGNLNTDTPPLRIFNKETDIPRSQVSYPNFFRYTLTEWIYESDMSESEKRSYPSYVTAGGYLKCYDAKTAWRNSWDKANKEDRLKCLALPNWNNEIFKEISGIDVEKELNMWNDAPEYVEVTLQEIADNMGG